MSASIVPGKKKQPGSAAKKSMLGSIISGEKRKEKKKQKLAMKEQAELERIINAVNRVDAPVNPDSSEWKEFQKMQEKIVTALVETQARLTQIGETTVVNDMLPATSQPSQPDESAATSVPQPASATANEDDAYAQVLPSIARSDTNASTATLSSTNNDAPPAPPNLQPPDDPFDTRRALEVLQQAAQICAMVEKVQVARMQQHGYEVNDSYDPFDTSKARAVIESLKNSSVLANARKQAKLISTESMEHDEQVTEEDDPFNTSRALGVISKAVALCDRLTGKAKTVDDLLNMEAEQETESDEDLDPFDTSRANNVMNTALNLCNRVVSSPAPPSAEQPTSAENSVATEQPATAEHTVANEQPVSTENTATIAQPAITEHAVAAEQSAAAQQTPIVDEQQPIVEQLPSDDQLPDSDKDVALSEVQTVSVCVAQPPNDDTASHTAHEATNDDRVAVHEPPEEPQVTADDGDNEQSVSHLMPGHPRRPPPIPPNLQLPDSAVAINIISPTPVATPLDTRTCNFDRPRPPPPPPPCPEPQRAPEVSASDENDDADRAPTPQATPLETDQCESDNVVADAAEKLQKLADDQPQQFEFEASSEATADDEKFFATATKSGPVAAEDAFAPAEQAAPPADQQGTFEDDQFCRMETADVAQQQQHQTPPAPLAQPVSQPFPQPLPQPVTQPVLPRKPSLDESSDEETNPFAVNFKIRQSTRARVAPDPIPVLLPKPSKVDRSERVADPLGIEQARRQQHQAEQDAEDDKFEKLKFEANFDDDAAPQPDAANDEAQAWHVDATQLADPDKAKEFEYVPPAETFAPFHPPVGNNEWRLLMRLPEKKKLGVARVWHPVIVRLAFPEQTGYTPAHTAGYTPTHVASSYTPTHAATGAEGATQAASYSTNPFMSAPAPAPAPAATSASFALPPEKPKPLVRIYFNENDPRPAREYTLDANLQLSKETLQQYDQLGKLHVVKLQQVSYKEMVGMKAEKLMSFKALQTLMNKPKGTHALDHIPQEHELAKLGGFDINVVRSFIWALEDTLMTIESHRDTTRSYAKEELYAYQRDEYEAECDRNCRIVTHKARARILFLAFVTGMPICELGLNDKWRMGREVVRRQDIIPVMHDDWIDIYEPEFHSSIDRAEYERSHVIRFQPLDGCKVELMRFRVSLRENRELPLQVRCRFAVEGMRVSIRCDLIVPGYYSRNVKLGQVPCEKVQVRIPVPEAWAHLFRTEKAFKPIGSIHSVTRKAGKIKGLERLSQIAQPILRSSLLEVDCGLAKYEHLYRAIVWRVPRLPERNEGLYKTHLLSCQFQIGPNDPVPPPDQLQKSMNVEFRMPSSTVSGTTVRSIAVEHPNPPEKWVRYKAHFAYTVDIDYVFGSNALAGQPDAAPSLFRESEIAAINANSNIGAPPPDSDDMQPAGYDPRTTAYDSYGAGYSEYSGQS